MDRASQQRGRIAEDKVLSRRQYVDKFRKSVIALRSIPASIDKQKPE